MMEGICGCFVQHHKQGGTFHGIFSSGVEFVAHPVLVVVALFGYFLIHFIFRIFFCDGAINSMVGNDVMCVQWAFMCF